MLLANILFLVAASTVYIGIGAFAHPAVNSGATENSNESEIREKLYAKMYSYMIHSKAYTNFTLEDAKHHIDEVEDWKAPKELQEKFPYYLSGYDRNNQPVWFMEMGKFNIREQIERGPEYAHNLTEYMFQGIHRAIKSMIVKDTPEKEVRTLVIIGDCQGLDLIQTAHIPTVQYLLNTLRRYSDFINLMVGHGIFFNMNYVTTILFDSVRPVLGGVFERIDLMSPNEAKWKEALRKTLPDEVIPTWYGGNKGYKPIQVYG